MKKKHMIAHILATITIILWATAYTLTPYELEVFSPAALGLIRHVIASVVLVIIGCIKKIGLPKVKDIPKFILSGVLGITLYTVAYNWGAQFVSGTVCGILLATNPIFTAILSSLLFKEKIHLGGWIAIGIGFIGIVIVTLSQNADSAAAGNSLWGIIVVIAASCLFAGYNITQRKLSRTYTPLSSIIYTFVCGTILLLVFTPETIPQIAAAPTDKLLTAVYLGLFPSAIGFSLWTLALSKAKNTSTIANYCFVTPFIAMLMGLGLTGELPPAGALIGGVIIILGLILFTMLNKSPKKLFPQEPQK